MADTRDRIVAATATLFQQRGYTGSGLKQISTDSAAPFGSLYHFFPGGKEELAAVTLRWSGLGYQLLVEAVLDAAPDIVSGVRDAFAGATETLRESDYADACPIATVALEVASTNEGLRRVTAEVFEGWLAALAGRFAAAGIGVERARELAIVFVATIEGGFLLSRAAKDTTAMDALGRSVTEMVRAEVSRL
ncbi:MAG: TetR/AcrR family transcriptional regulator [Acidimicrobiales bacterium]